MNFVYYFLSLEENDEKKYIEAIIEEIFEEEEENLKKIVTEMLFAAHKYVKNNGDESSVSLREIKRFKECYYVFKKYFENKKKVLEKKEIEEEKLDDQAIIKRKSIILSLYTCYYMKISKNEIRTQFDTKIKDKGNETKMGLLDLIQKNKINMILIIQIF